MIPWPEKRPWQSCKGVLTSFSTQKARLIPFVQFSSNPQKAWIRVIFIENNLHARQNSIRAAEEIYEKHTPVGAPAGRQIHSHPIVCVIEVDQFDG